MSIVTNLADFITTLLFRS